jgi:hypothetical protein
LPSQFLRENNFTNVSISTYFPFMGVSKGYSMNCWFTGNLGDAILAGESLAQIKELFLAEYQTNNNSNEQALFIRHESEGRLHCELKVYFSPATIIVAKTINATPCNKPCPNGLSLLAGSKESWSILFPEKGVTSR